MSARSTIFAPYFSPHFGAGFDHHSGIHHSGIMLADDLTTDLITDPAADFARSAHPKGAPTQPVYPAQGRGFLRGLQLSGGAET